MNCYNVMWRIWLTPGFYSNTERCPGKGRWPGTGNSCKLPDADGLRANKGKQVTPFASERLDAYQMLLAGCTWASDIAFSNSTANKQPPPLGICDLWAQLPRKCHPSYAAIWGRMCPDRMSSFCVSDGAVGSFRKPHVPTWACVSWPRPPCLICAQQLCMCLTLLVTLMLGESSHLEGSDLTVGPLCSYRRNFSECY